MHDKIFFMTFSRPEPKVKWANDRGNLLRALSQCFIIPSHRCCHRRYTNTEYIYKMCNIFAHGNWRQQYRRFISHSEIRHQNYSLTATSFVLEKKIRHPWKNKRKTLGKRSWCTRGDNSTTYCRTIHVLYSSGPPVVK